MTLVLIGDDQQATNPLIFRTKVHGRSSAAWQEGDGRGGGLRGNGEWDGNNTYQPALCVC